MYFPYFDNYEFAIMKSLELRLRFVRIAITSPFDKLVEHWFQVSAIVPLAKRDVADDLDVLHVVFVFELLLGVNFENALTVGMGRLSSFRLLFTDETWSSADS